jgi:hypothetical protein
MYFLLPSSAQFSPFVSVTVQSYLIPFGTLYTNIKRNVIAALVIANDRDITQKEALESLTVCPQSAN